MPKDTGLIPAKIHKLSQICEYPKGCSEQATELAAWSSYDELGCRLQQIGCYCDKHSQELVDLVAPEYHTHCPNCNCLFGVG